MESKLTIKMERIMICLLSKKFKNHLKEIWSKQKNVLVLGLTVQLKSMS